MNHKRFISRGAACFHVDYTGEPVDFHFLLLPNLTLLAFSAAIEPLRIANQVTRKCLYRWFTMSQDGRPVACSNGVTITPDAALLPVPQNSLAFICSGVEPQHAAAPATLNWIRRQNSFNTCVGSICSGAYALAQAGVLSGRRFTLHWENQPAFAELFPHLVPTQNLYEIDRHLLTCGGGSAATDMMLQIIENDHGKDLALIVSDMCIHARDRHSQVPQKSAFSIAIGSRNQRLINAMQMMQDQIEEPLELSEIATETGISRRQMERLFKRYIGLSPNQYYHDLRLKRAHALLIDTNMSITEIAFACGFSSSNQFTRRFKQQFDKSPFDLKKSWRKGLN
jgi:transcriptional regulator GlxA family with amidase domain